MNKDEIIAYGLVMEASRFHRNKKREWGVLFLLEDRLVFEGNQGGEIEIPLRKIDVVGKTTLGTYEHTFEVTTRSSLYKFIVGTTRDDVNKIFKLKEDQWIDKIWNQFYKLKSSGGGESDTWDDIVEEEAVDESGKGDKGKKVVEEEDEMDVEELDDEDIEDYDDVEEIPSEDFELLE